jgi:small subunit ribosomal protein S1
MSDESAKTTETQKEAQLQEQLQEEYLRSLDELEVGQLVDGVVVAKTNEQIFVDVGYKSEGKINLEEFKEIPEIGDTVQVVLLNKETQSGEVVVSKRKADERIFWNELRTASENKQPVGGTVAKSIKGGFDIHLGFGVHGFNPISKMDLHRIDKPEQYVGMETQFMVERIYNNNRVNIILSRRNWLEEEVERKKQEFFANTSIGDSVSGRVKSFTSFGAFIDLGGFDGLLHINDMSWGHVTKPKDFVKKNQEIELKVIKLDYENQKINLSMKHFTEDPWLHFEEKYAVDDVVTGTVTKLTDFGAFIELEEGIEGLAHISELSWVKHIQHPKEVLSIGDEVETKILGYDVQAGKVSLGIKQVLPNPWDSIGQRFPEGMRVHKPVKKITNTGAFVELEEGIDAFLHVDDISWTKRYKNPSAVLTEGEEIDCIVISVESDNHNIRVGIKQLSEDPWESLKKAYPERSIIEGTVSGVTDFGVFVRVQGDIEGLINKMNLCDPKREDVEKALGEYKEGDKVRAVITEINPAKQKLGLSIRELEKQEQRQELQKYIHSEEASSTVTLGDLIKDKDSQ